LRALPAKEAIDDRSLLLMKAKQLLLLVLLLHATKGERWK
jgi:hypothetical protein